MLIEEKIQKLERDILRYKEACQSAWPRPVDYTNLIDAQYALRDLNEGQNAR